MPGRCGEVAGPAPWSSPRGVMMRRPAVDPRFGPLLRQLREERGLSLRRLAERALTSKSQVYSYEVGDAVPCMRTVELLDRALDVGGRLAALVMSSPPAPTPLSD